MADRVAVEDELREAESSRIPYGSVRHSSISLTEAWAAVLRNWRLFLSIVGGSAAACLLYWLIAPNQYEARGKVELRSAPESVLALDGRQATVSGAFATGQVRLETLANVLRSDQLAWDVITRLVLYRDSGFSRTFQGKFAGFRPDAASADAKEYLLNEFHEDLTVESVPHTLVLEIRFRSGDPALSTAVVNALIEAYARQEMNARMQATRNGIAWLDAQLQELKEKLNRDEQRLTEFQRAHGILSGSDSIRDGKSAEVAHSATLTAVDALSRELGNAATERLLREAEYRAATTGDPELVYASDARSGPAGNLETALLQQLHARRSDLKQEEAQLAIEHGPNFPRLVEIRKQMQEADEQIKAADAKLVERFRSAWKTSLDRERLLRRSLDEATGAGLKASEAGLQYTAMWQEANANREVYLRMMQQDEEAGLASGSMGSAVSVIDYARPAAKPVSPNLPVDMGITLFLAFWAALSAVLGREALQRRHIHAVVLAGGVFLAWGTCGGQAPTPSTSGLPTGVARLPQSGETKSVPNAKDAPTVWNAGESKWAGVPPGTSGPGQVMEAPIGPGDILAVTETHGPELHATVRVSEAGTVTLPLAGEVRLEGLDERAAAGAIEAALRDRGMLLHPQVTVLVTAYAGQDVSVLGEVTRPGVYSYTVHHRLLDLISAASGLSQNAGRLVTITHRGDSEKQETVDLDPAGADGGGKHNPELLPGDTVQVNRAGLVYVVGDVIRPGGFPVEPAQTTTVLQALSLAWGPAQNAALKKAVLIRKQAGGRTVTTLNLKRMLRGLEPDTPVLDGDILFVPDSMAKNLLSRSLESVIQSAAGVSIYSGLVYSQRF